MAMEEDDYPKEYRHLYHKEPHFGKGVPAWWVLVDGQPVVHKQGEKNWDTTVEPVIVELVTKKLAGGGTFSSIGSRVGSP